MTELLTFVALCLIDFIMKFTPAYPIIMNAYLSMAIMIIVFCNFFIELLHNKYREAKRRYIMICILYGLLIIDGILGICYFSYILEDNLIVKRIVQIILYGSYIAALVFVKWSNLKLTSSYGKTYRNFIIIEIVLSAVLIILDYYIDGMVLAMHPWLMGAVKAILAILTITSLIVYQYTPYWNHKQILLTRLIMLVRTYQVDSAVVPPQREIESDAVLREVKYVLEQGFIRPMEMNRLTKQLYDLMLEKGYDRAPAVKYTAMFSQTIIMNLMRRKWDFSYIPNFILRWFRKYEKYKGNSRK